VIEFLLAKPSNCVGPEFKPQYQKKEKKGITIKPQGCVSPKEKTDWLCPCPLALYPKLQMRAGGMVQPVKYLPSKREALSSSPNNTKKKNKKKKPQNSRQQPTVPLCLEPAQKVFLEQDLSTTEVRAHLAASKSLVLIF
jgi:hypothetical protein